MRTSVRASLTWQSALLPKITVSFNVAGGRATNESHIVHLSRVIKPITEKAGVPQPQQALFRLPKQQPLYRVFVKRQVCARGHDARPKGPLQYLNPCTEY